VSCSEIIESHAHNNRQGVSTGAALNRPPLPSDDVSDDVHKHVVSLQYSSVYMVHVRHCEVSVWSIQHTDRRCGVGG
jgi:hypothetical protein